MEVLWLYKQTIQQKLQKIPEHSSIVVEWRNTKTIISQGELKVWENTVCLYKRKN